MYRQKFPDRGINIGRGEFLCLIFLLCSDNTSAFLYFTSAEAAPFPSRSPKKKKENVLNE